MSTANYRKLVVIARGGWVERDGVKYFQDNDGFYIDQIAPMFEEVVVWTRKMPVQGYVPNYGYVFQASNVRCVDIMNPPSQAGWSRLISDTVRGLASLREADVTFAYVNTIRGCLFAYLGATFSRTKVVVYNGTNLKLGLEVTQASPMKRRILLTLEQMSMRAADFRLVTGPYLLKQFEKFGDIEMVVPATRILRREPPPRRRLLSDGPVRLICPVHLRKPKNVDVLVKACKILKDEGLDFQFDIVGDGTERESLERLSEDLGLSDKIVFHGYVSDGEKLFEQLNAADIVLLASEFEGFPRTVWEAIYCGVYVVTTQVGGVEHLFDATQMSILSSNTPEAFAKAIIQVAESPERLNQAVDKSQTTFHSLFGKSVSEQFGNCVEYALANKERRGLRNLLGLRR